MSDDDGEKDCDHEVEPRCPCNELAPKVALFVLLLAVLGAVHAIVEFARQ